MFGLDKQSRINRKLRNAAREGDLAAIEEALKEGADIESKSGPYKLSPLNWAAYHGKASAAALLIEKGANIESPDKSGETPLVNALRFGNEETVLLLLDKGANAYAQSGLTVTELAAQRRMRTVTKRFAPPAPPAPVPPPAPVKPQAPARAESPDEVVFFRPLGNRMLEEVFNFASKERITLLRNGMDGPVEAMTREGFSAIQDQGALRHAFEVYKQKGGKAEEREIFPAGLVKHKIEPRAN